MSLRSTRRSLRSKRIESGAHGPQKVQLSQRQLFTRVLGVVGLVLVVGGGITWAVAKHSYDSASEVYGFARTMQGGAIWADDSPIQIAAAWVWVGIVATILGVLVLVAWVIVLATGRSGHSAPLTLTETRQARAGIVSGPSLSELAAMHGRGELTDEEFSAAKRNLLGL